MKTSKLVFQVYNHGKKILIEYDLGLKKDVTHWCTYQHNHKYTFDYLRQPLCKKHDWIRYTPQYQW